MREIIDGVTLTDMLLCAASALDSCKEQINDLNVFPVPDGDTGTNMSMTLAAGAAELRSKAPKTVGETAKIAASALMRGARGNSGVILSLLFRGMSKILKDKETCSAYDFAKAMVEGVDTAYKAVMKPAEGTILTVSKMAAASAADFAETGTDMELLLSCALETARNALAETVNQNPVLKKAGVVDAGGKGYVVILEAMLACLRDGATPETYGAVETGAPVRDKADFAAFDNQEITFAFDTVFIVRRTTDKPLDGLREYLNSIGDSLVIGEDDEAFKVHVHTDIPGSALNEAQKYGTLEVAKIENMRIQHDDLSAGRTAISADDLDHEDEPVAAVQPEKEFGTVVVCAGDGMQGLFKELGADSIVTGGQTMNPSTEDILKAVESVPARTVLVFPNNKNIIMAAEQCARLTEKKVLVIPTKTVPQGVTAMLSMDTYSQTEEELLEVTGEAIESVSTALVTYAARNSDFDGYEIKADEYLALLDGALLGSSPDLNDLVTRLGNRLAERDPEFVTVYYGEGVEADDAQQVADVLEELCPEAEISLVYGGQPVYYYMISAE